MRGIEGRVGIVTGGGRGIGASIARLLAERGALVCIAGTGEKDLHTVTEVISRAGGRAHYVVADVSKEDDVERLFDEARRQLGPPRLLVNNAGVAPIGKTAQFSLDDWNRCLAVNLTGTFLCCREAFKSMPQDGGGAIVNISSGAVRRGHSGWAAYTASKSGVLGLTKSISEEGAGLGIRVNSVCPGGTRTAMRRKIFGDEPEGSLLAPEDVAEVVLFLLSEMAHEVRAAELEVRKHK